jgi:hypothetical protein
LRWWEIVGPERVNAGVRWQTHASPPGVEAIIDSSCRRTGSPMALNMGAIAAASAVLIGAADSGAQHASCFDIALA